MRQMHHFHSKFDSVFNLRAMLVEEFKEQVPDNTTFRIGYIEEKHRMSIITNDNVKCMYEKHVNGEIILWCDGRSDDVQGLGKRKREEQIIRHNERDLEVEDVYQELLEKHNDQYDIPKLRLWARMICSKIHSSMKSHLTYQRSLDQALLKNVSGHKVYQML